MDDPGAYGPAGAGVWQRVWPSVGRDLAIMAVVALVIVPIRWAMRRAARKRHAVVAPAPEAGS